MSQTRIQFVANYLNVTLPKDQEWRLLGDPELLSLSQRLDALKPRLKSMQGKEGGDQIMAWAADMWAAIGDNDKTGAAVALGKIMDALDDLPTGAPPGDRVAEQDAARKRRAAELKTAAGLLSLHDKSLPDDFPDLLGKRDGFVLNVPDAPDKDLLARIEKAFTGLEKAFEKQRTNFAQQLEKLALTARNLREEAAGISAPEGATGQEVTEFSDKAREIADNVPEEPSRDEDLNPTRQAIKELKEQARTLKSEIDDNRRPRHKRAVDLQQPIETLAKKCTSPPLRENDARELADELQKMAGIQEGYADWENIATWKEEDVKSLESRLTAASEKFDRLIEAIETLRRGFDKAAEGADQAVKDSSVFALSGTQQKVYADRIDTCRKAVETDVYSAEDQIAAVEKIAEDTRAFAKLLDGYKTRIETTPAKAPKGALDAEVKLLAKKRKTALDALSLLEPA